MASNGLSHFLGGGASSNSNVASTEKTSDGLVHFLDMSSNCLSHFLGGGASSNSNVAFADLDIAALFVWAASDCMMMDSSPSCSSPTDSVFNST
jgi:hypothetical protein